MDTTRLMQDYRNAYRQQQIELLRHAIQRWDAARARLIASRSTDNERYDNLTQLTNAAFEEIIRLKALME